VTLHANDVMPTNADGTLGLAQNSDLYHLSGIDQ
jgi:Xaa-Pro aminopeptidase